MKRIHVNLSEGYDVRIGEGLLEKAGEEIASVIPACKAGVITDDTVMNLYGEKLKDCLIKSGFSVEIFSFPAGEKQKNMQTLGSILNWLGKNEISRGDVVVALGGGVVGDVAGFAAAVYQRGVPFVQIPTTLLSAVDASVGGKTAVDLPCGKNMAGAFYQPKLVLCDTGIMRILPPEIAREGLAEILKCGMLQDAELFESVASGNWKNKIEDTIAACVSIKRFYVEKDEKDVGERRYLNLGHTFGHPLEVLSAYTITHGQAVAMGLMMAARAAGMETKKLRQAIEACGLPVCAPFSAAELAKIAVSDKKRRGEKITLVLPERIGKCCLREIGTEDLLSLFEKATGEKT